MRVNPTTPIQSCPNCGSTVATMFCGSCGQEADIHEQTLREYLVDISYDFLSVDGKIWKGFRDLVLWPGLLTKDYLDGKRASRPVPSRLFLVMTVIVFGVAPFVYRLFGAGEAFTESIGLRLLESISPILRGMGYGEGVTPAVRQALEDNASLGALLSVIPLCIALVMMRVPRGSMFNVHIAHAFHLTAATMILLLVGQIGTWGFVPTLIAVPWYFRQMYRTQDTTQKKRVWWLFGCIAAGWIFAIIWLWAGLEMAGFVVNSEAMEITASDTVSILVVFPLLVMLAFTILIIAFVGDIFYIASSLMRVGALPMRSALVRAFVLMLVMIGARIGLVIAPLLLQL